MSAPFFFGHLGRRVLTCVALSGCGGCERGRRLDTAGPTCTSGFADTASVQPPLTDTSDCPDNMYPDQLYLDADGDGYGTERTIAYGCPGEVDGYVFDNTDCDDADPDINPGQPDVMGNRRDDNCDGLLERCDNDEDGWGDARAGGKDCDDLDAGVHPGVDERWRLPWTDMNCDGSLVGQLGMLAGMHEGGTGYAFAPAGDLNGDGHPEFLVSVPKAHWYEGVTFVASGPVGDLLDLNTEAVSLIGSSVLNHPGSGLAGGVDLDGDEALDIAISVGNPYNYANGGVYVISHPTDGTLSEVASARVIAASTEDDFGSGVALLGDVNDDAAPDMLVGAELADGASGLSGAAYVIAGPFSGDQNAADAWLTLEGEKPFDHVGAAVANAGDTDGDGVDDLLISGAGHAGDASFPALYLLDGRRSGVVALEDADGLLTSDAAGTLSWYWYALAVGDVDGDGRADLLMGDPGRWDVGDGTGAVWLYTEPAIGWVGPSHAAASIRTSQPGTSLGMAVALTGDLDGDELPDVAVGAPEQDRPGTSRVGAVFVYAGPMEGSYTLDDAMYRLYGVSDGDGMGMALGAAGDLTGDGVADLLVGAPGLTGPGDSDTAFLLVGGTL